MIDLKEPPKQQAVLRMKKKSLIIGLSVTAILLLSNTTTSFAQKDISGLFKSTPDDSRRLIESYLNPLFKGFGSGLSAGWYNTAKTKKLGHFELRISAGGAFVPAADKSFDITQIGLSSNITPSNPQSTVAPTVAGDKNTIPPQIDIHASGQPIIQNLNLPQGAGLFVVPAPQIQATVGLPKGVDVSLRLMPKIKLGDAGSVYMIGGGVRLNIGQLIKAKVVTKLPFDLAVAAGYTQFHYNLPLDVQAPGTNYTDQSLDGRISGFNLEGIISKRLLFFTPFVSVGYQSSRTKVNLIGDYPIEIGNGNYVTYHDPISIDKRYLSGLRADIGFQLQLLLLRVYGSYSLAAYNSVNVGIGLGIGK
ncbi:MAG: DUF6588 family protein [Sphingobacteriaceae bacterium]